MDLTNLTDQEIKALLMQYDSEMRKLSFQMQIIQGTIQKLHEKLGGISMPVVSPIIQQTVSNQTISSATETPKEEEIAKIEKEPIAKTLTENKQPILEIREKKKPGPKPKIKPETSLEEVTEPKKRGRKPKLKTEPDREKRIYTKDNPWPDFVLGQLNKYNHVLNSAQIYDYAEEENEVKKYGLQRSVMRDMVSRALHQLANNKKVIAKIPLEAGKGYNYALMEWLDGTELREEFIP